MFADQPTLNDAITALLVYIQIGSLVWMFVHSRGRLARVYATEATGSGRMLDFIGDVLITMVLIIGWPVMLIALRKGKLQ